MGFWDGMPLEFTTLNVWALTCTHLGLKAAGEENWHLANCTGGFPSGWIPTERDRRLHVVCPLFFSLSKLHVSSIGIYFYRLRADELVGIRFT